jgi:hypothetical protein
VWKSIKYALPAALMLFAVAASADEARILELKHREAAEMIPLLQPLLGPNDALTGTGYRLILRTSDAKRREIEKLLAQLDVAPRTVIITVAQVRAADASAELSRLSGAVDVGEHGRVIVSRPAPGGDGATLRAGTGDNSVTYQTRHRSTSLNSTERQTLRVLEGHSAFVRIGQSIPMVRKILGGRGSVVQGIEYRDITGGFQVSPRIAGEFVQLEITPRLAAVRDPASGISDFREYASTIRVRPGEWMDLGAVLSTHDMVSNAILSGEGNEGSEAWTVLVRVKVE